MQPGDRVIYLANQDVRLDRDLGTVTGLDYQGNPVVEFDDGWVTAVDLFEIKLFVDRQPKEKPFHLHFGCSEDPCPWPGHS